MLRFRSIAQTLAKIKGLAMGIDKRDIYSTLLLFLAVFSGYFWGSMVKLERAKIPLQIERYKPEFPTPLCEPKIEPKSEVTIKQEQVPIMPIKPAEKPNMGLYVGSKSGSKYHLPNCPGALRISAENKVFFASKEEALAKGYTPAANCKGL